MLETTTRSADVWAMVLAAGGGTRFGAPKQFLDLGGVSLLDRTLMTLAPHCDGIVVALPKEAVGGNRPWQPPQLGVPLIGVPGGAQRADSVRAALTRIPAQAGVVVVADAAHPLASHTLVRSVIEAVLVGADGALPGLPLTEVLADIDADGVRRAGLPRAPEPPASTRVLVQTPHAFEAGALRRAHAQGATTAEDSALVAAAGGRIVAVPGEPTNIHVTTPAELELARFIAASAWGR